MRALLLRHALLGLAQQLSMSPPPLQQRRLIPEDTGRSSSRVRLLPASPVNTPQAEEHILQPLPLPGMIWQIASITLHIAGRSLARRWKLSPKS